MGERLSAGTGRHAAINDDPDSFICVVAGRKGRDPQKADIVKDGLEFPLCAISGCGQRSKLPAARTAVQWCTTTR
jgi:hypothetical protein